MSTFQFDLQLNKTLQHNKNKISQTQRSKKSNILSLTQRGLNQAHRNDSSDIWKLIHNCDAQTQVDSCVNSLSRQYDFINENQQKSFKRSCKRPQQSTLNASNTQNQNQIKKVEEIKQSSKKIKQENLKSKKNILSKQRSNIKKTQSILLKQSQKQELIKCQNLNKMNNEIKMYLEKQKFASRNLSNSAFAKLYNRPCIQSYGYGNTSAQSQATNNLLKTHNITPHTNQNHPQSYQTYQNALQYAKRTIINVQNKQQRIRRQFLRWFDDSVVEAAQMQLWKLNQQRKTKSQQKKRIKYEQLQKQQNENENKEEMKDKILKRKSLKQSLGNKQPQFVYKYENNNGQIRFSKDRHGISCYVDSQFLANDQALLNFQKQQRQIYPEKVKQEDMNLDQIRKNNFIKSIQQNHPGHYLIPCVITSYDKNKYQFRKKRVQSTIN